MKKAVFNWSGGKDSALALHKILEEQEYEIVCLLTTINQEFNRISMHGVRKELLEEQAKSIGIPLYIIEVPKELTMEKYDTLMKEELIFLKRKHHISHAIFGDIFLEDLKKYREERLGKLGLTAVFPLWGQDTLTTVNEFISLGFKAITVCIDAQKMNDSLVGRIINEEFIKELPDDVDPCGENGEFHSFVFDGPVFNETIQFNLGEKVKRKYSSDNPDWNKSFCFCDLEPLIPNSNS